MHREDQFGIILTDEICTHGNPARLCKECQIEAMQVKKQAKKRVPIKALKNRSTDQENKIADDYKAAGFTRAKRQAMSGALAVLPGDVDPGSLFLVEAKLTRAGNLVIKTEWLEQVRRQAADMGRAGFFALHAWVGKDNKHYGKVVIVDEALWYTVCAKFKEQEASSDVLNTQIDRMEKDIG